MAHLSISLLGDISVTLAGQKITHFRSDKVLALLIYLAVEAEQPPRRETLVGLLWPNHTEADARHNLSQSLLRLRHAIQDRQTSPPFLLATRQTIHLNPISDHWLDVAAFLSYVKSTSVGLGDQQPDLHALRQAAELYRGDFLSRFSLPDNNPFEEWVTTKREQLRQQAQKALTWLVSYYEVQAEYEPAHHYAWRLVELDPLNEIGQRRLMRLLALSGRRQAALSQFETCRQQLTDGLGLEPEPETVTLYQQILNGDLKIPPKPPAFHIPAQPATTSSPNQYKILSRLEPMPDQHLFGVEQAQAELSERLQAQGRPWLVAIDGLGGIGKTSLANSLVRHLLLTDRFHDIGWISAKQEQFLPETGLKTTGRPALDEETLIDCLLEQLSHPPHPSASAQEKRLALTQLLNEQPCLIVIDNLETAVDYETLLPTLRQLANPSKFLLTSRVSLKPHADVYCFGLTELPQQEALAFIKYEAESRGLASLFNASEGQLEEIYHVVGGNPLALKLVIGQVSFLPLPHVLDNLEQAQGETIDQLYIYIYWQAWHMLDQAGQHLFLTLPVIPRGTFSELAEISELDQAQLQHALSQLITLSLVQIGGDLAEPIYRLHRLTETFLLHEVVKWQADPPPDIERVE